MLKKILLIFSILFISSCHPNWYKPHGKLFRQMPEGSPGFQLGWLHGCQSGMGTQFGSAIFMTFYGWSRDIDITSVTPNIEAIKKRYPKKLKGVNWNDLNDIKKNFSDYNTIFWAAHAFCRHSTLGILQNSGLEPDLSAGGRWHPHQHTIGAAWKMTGKGDTRIGAGGNSSLW